MRGPATLGHFFVCQRSSAHRRQRRDREIKCRVSSGDARLSRCPKQHPKRRTTKPLLRRRWGLSIGGQSVEEGADDLGADLVEVRHAVTRLAEASEAIKASEDTSPLRVGDPPVLEFAREQ
jgi:hypothetical protein